ncbi:MAG: type II secretion system F family protein [Candidatus Gracilibacteria bacterium]|nr:type II secretion system F family protein [Candidatus Gracilibacteria bacterium]MDD2908301.1 type II secretion system F family protein [Candidatus Gracilibacteria bacterium]
MSESDYRIIDSSSSQDKSSKSFSFSFTDINDWFISQQKISSKGKVIFFRLLATMVNAGIPILRAISILEKQEKDVILKKLYTNLVSGIKLGKNLSIGLRDYGGNFSDSECSIIESGEKTGKLNSALVQLADQTEKVAGISRKFKGALIYPAAIVSIMFAAIVLLMTMVVPKIVEMFGDKSKLPPLTQFLIFVSDFFINYLWLMLIFMFGFFVFIKLRYKTPDGKYRLDGILLKIPILGMINKKVILSKFARVFSNLLSSGISIVECLRIVSDVVGNEVYRQRLLLLREDVKKGVKIGESLEDDNLFPEMLVQMIKVGEETAKLDTIILKIADFYDDEVDQSVNNIQKLLEPFIIVTMSIVVGFIAVGIMQPIMGLADTLSEK